MTNYSDDRQFQNALSALSQVATLKPPSFSGPSVSDCDRLLRKVAAYYKLKPTHSPRFEGITLLEETKSRCRFLEIGYREVRFEEASASTFQGEYLLIDEKTGELTFFYPYHQRYKALSTKNDHEQTLLSFPRLSENQIAFQLYQPISQQKPGLFSFLNHLFRRHYGTLISAAGIGAILAGFSVAFPLVTGFVLDTLVPNAQYRAFYAMMLGLACVTLSQFLFNWIQSILILRMNSQVQNHLYAAIWLRLLSVKMPFFKQFPAGDLAYRAMAIPRLQQALGVVQLTAVLTAVFSITQVGLMMAVDLQLTLFLVPVMLLVFGLVVLMTTILIRRYTDLEALSGKSQSLVYQFISGIAKLKVASRQKRAFSIWAFTFAKERRLYSAIAMRQHLLQACFTLLPFIASILLFACVGFSWVTTLSAGVLMVFSTALGQWISAVLGLCQAILSAAPAFPLLTRLHPILAENPESSEGPRVVIKPTGVLEVAHVSFTYPDGAQVLKDINFKINPGECVAIVGASGCGKSTLFRLLLGFETPDHGSILYEGTPLQEIDLVQLRRSFGVVLQQSEVFSESIFDNLAGSLPYTTDEVWNALDKVGLKDEIEALPMGLHTIVGDQNSLSGGQRQRLMIARALIHNPKFLFLDEATSALDNHAQKQVADRISKLNMTRILIAHRLSTIRQADKIIVLENGKIAEAGTYEELISKNGIFSGLATRQL